MDPNGLPDVDAVFQIVRWDEVNRRAEQAKARLGEAQQLFTEMGATARAAEVEKAEREHAS